MGFVTTVEAVLKGTEEHERFERTPLTGVVGDFWDTVREPCALCGLYHPLGWQDRKRPAPGGR